MMEFIYSERGVTTARIVIPLVLLLLTELAFRLGVRQAERWKDEMRGQVATVQAATLGLLALLLGFALSMAEDRFVARRALLVSETNAIGTTYLRASFLPEPRATEVRALLRRYVTIRRRFFDAGTIPGIEEAAARSATMHREIWATSARAIREHPDWDVLGAYVESLNEMIDLEAAQFAALTHHVPTAIVRLLFVVACVAVWTTGFGCGLTGERAFLSLVVVPLLIAFACTALLDLDRPRLGRVRIDDGALERLERSLRSMP